MPGAFEGPLLVLSSTGAPFPRELTVDVIKHMNLRSPRTVRPGWKDPLGDRRYQTCFGLSQVQSASCDRTSEPFRAQSRATAQHDGSPPYLSAGGRAWLRGSVSKFHSLLSDMLLQKAVTDSKRSLS